MSFHRSRLVSVLGLSLAFSLASSLLGACSNSTEPRSGTGVAGGTGTQAGTAGTGTGTTGTGSGTAGTTTTTGASGDNGSSGTAGQTTSGTAGGSAQGTAGSGSGTSGTTGTAGGGTAGNSGTAGTTAAGGTTGTAGVTGLGGASAECNPPPPRAINVTGTGTYSGSYNGQPLYLNKDKKPIQGKLFLLLPGIGNGPGAGGFESFVKIYGFHVFAPKTDSNLTGGQVPQSYKDTLKTNPTDHEANRQVADARMELWDGKDRVSWYTPPMSIVNQTIGAINYAMQQDPGGDWGFYLNADGTLRTTDIWVVGYSWGAQTWSMMSTYVRFGRVIAASGPVNEGFPNGAWMTDPSATPVNCKYMLSSDGQIAEMAPNVMKAGWPGQVVMVHTTSPGPYTDDQHLFEMIGGDGGTTPGGHTVFCNDNPANGWWPVCKHVLGQPM
jgi:hypothetical protein